MLIFFWILASMGVAYAAKLSKRNPACWFILSVVLTPLVGSVALTLVNRHGIFWKS